MNNIPAKKSLGQNFLKSKVALTRMIEAGEVNNSDIILEVGPGKGVLTEKLLAMTEKVIAVEKDDRLIEFLQEKFAEEIKNNKLELIHSDILDLDSRKGEYKIIANIPYYITGQFLRKFLETENQPKKIVVMVQKEIADRIIARDGKENLLSLSVKAFGEPKKIMKVDKENFSPAPKVDSAILLINNISKNFFIENKIAEKDFFEIIHAGFAHKRKILLGNLKTEMDNNKNLEEVFELNKISKKARAEDLALNDWVKLIKALQ
jgi:16S rRNA (adenine1518-N6/adenine1519-N6)-dimethyltransferase